MTLIELYDKDAVKNILGVLTLLPDQVIYLYDKEMRDETRFRGLEKCFRRHRSDIIVKTVPVDIMDTRGIYETVKEIVSEFGECVIDLNGGSELMIIGTARAAIECKVKMYYTDIIRNEMRDIFHSDEKIRTPYLSLEDFVDARGAKFMGNSHKAPHPEDFNRILSMSHYIFKNLSQWRNTCAYLQTAMADVPSQETYMKRKMVIFRARGRSYSPDVNILFQFQKLGFIKNLCVTKEGIEFSFENPTIRQYMINFGVWLELFVYINARQCGIFDDVVLGAMIDWNAYNGMNIAGNEIDVIAMHKSMPIFISCKLRPADSAAINELVIEKKRLGGWFSKCIIVTFGNEKNDKTGTYYRAEEMGVELLDRSDILSGRFSEKLKRSVIAHDLESLKWIKV